MSPHDTLRDRLADAAAPTSRPLPNARQLRTRAVRHRNQRRALTGAAVAVAVAAVAVAGSTLLTPRSTSLGPAAPGPSMTTAPSQTASPEPSGTATPDATPDATASPSSTGAAPLAQQEAQAFVEKFRFEDEQEWAGDLDFPTTVATEVQDLYAHVCTEGTVQAPEVLAMRTVVHPGPDTSSTRQLSVFADSTAAAEAFEQLRASIRTCHADQTEVLGDLGFDRSFVGGQLTLGQESFWVASKEVAVSTRPGFTPGQELYFSTAAVLVLDRNVITIIDDPATGDDGRARFVDQATAERLRLERALAPVLR